MKAELEGNPDFGHIRFLLEPGETVLTEAGAMAAMDPDVQVQSRMMGGVVPALMRRILTKESLMVGEYTAQRSGSRLQLSSPIPGEVVHRKVGPGGATMLQAGSFLACTPGVHLAPVFGGLRAIFSGEGMFFLKVTGEGDLWLNAYGSIVEKELSGGPFVVDTGHVVGWEDTLSWTIGGMGNLFSTLFSGEGLVLRFQGTGKVWLQTRSMGGLAGWLTGYCRG